MSDHKSILVAYVPGALGDAVLAAGIELAAEKNAQVTVVNSPHTGTLVDKHMIDDLAIERLNEQGTAAGVTVSVIQPASEDPVEAIADLVAQGTYEVLVIGLKKRSAVGKLIMGSTAQRLLLDIPIPILAVKPH